ncbi:MAG: ATP-grasp domain-containing protein [Clostridia bacterium]|nr:ATP-grasp domain-containing protein [Clostridia bacterium]
MKLGVLFGGRSYEHDISIITAAEVTAALKGRAEIYQIYAKDGEFYLVKGDLRIEDFAKNRVKKRKLLFHKKEDRGAIRVGHRKTALDCVILCCHGGEGEDGRFSALMECFDLAYTASSPLASAVTMDKRMTKTVCAEKGFKTAKGVVGHRGEDVIERAKALRYPLIVKPARLGSSIGVGVAHDELELISAVALAFSFDADVVIEELVSNVRELNCAAFREGDNIVVSGVENPKPWREFLTFREKYEGGKYKSGANALVEGALANRVRETTEQVYRAFELDGIARVDYLYDETSDVLYLNEINSQPGSLAYYLFEAVGIEFPELLFRVVKEGIRRFSQRDIISFNSRVLENLSAFSQK